MIHPLNQTWNGKFNSTIKDVESTLLSTLNSIKWPASNVYVFKQPVGCVCVCVCVHRTRAKWLLLHTGYFELKQSNNEMKSLKTKNKNCLYDPLNINGLRLLFNRHFICVVWHFTIFTQLMFQCVLFIIRSHKNHTNVYTNPIETSFQSVWIRCASRRWLWSKHNSIYPVIKTRFDVAHCDFEWSIVLC